MGTPTLAGWVIRDAHQHYGPSRCHRQFWPRTSRRVDVPSDRSTRIPASGPETGRLAATRRLRSDRSSISRAGLGTNQMNTILGLTVRSGRTAASRPETVDNPCVKRSCSAWVNGVEISSRICFGIFFGETCLHENDYHLLLTQQFPGLTQKFFCDPLI